MNYYLKASDLAAICQVDLKTIHNWFDRGRISGFRTPGRHLRFTSGSVVAFLDQFGFDVPPAWREQAKTEARAVSL